MAAPDSNTYGDPDRYQHGGSHYLRLGVQPWDVISTWPYEQRRGFFVGNCLKYLMRAGEKGPALEDFQKAHHYLEKLIKIEREHAFEQTQSLRESSSLDGRGD